MMKFFFFEKEMMRLNQLWTTLSWNQGNIKTLKYC